MDAPVDTLQFYSPLSKGGQGSVRDTLDKRVEMALKEAHEAMAMVIKPHPQHPPFLGWIRKMI